MAVKVRERDGAWWLFIDWKGRRKAKRVGIGKEGKRAAQVAAEKIQARLALGDLSVLEEAQAPPLAFRTYAERWLETNAPLRCKPSTVDQYRAMLRVHWMPVLGDLPLAAVTRDRVKGVLPTLGKTLRASTVRGCALVPLQACLSAAVEDGLIPANPAARLGKFVRSDVLPQERVDPFTREELAELLRVAEADMPEWYPALLTLARTGLRSSELAGLRPENLDFREGAVRVRRGIYKGRESTPKNGKGRRVDMSRQLARVLQGYLTLREAEAVVSEQPASPRLFPAPQGGPLDRRRFVETVWRPLLRRAGLRYRTLHQLRHTFASLLIQNGESLAYVRDQLGHHSIKLTVDTYGHLIPGANRQAVDRLDDDKNRVSVATSRNPAATDGEAVNALTSESVVGA